MRRPSARRSFFAPALALAALAAGAGESRAQSLRGSPASVERMWQGAMDEGLSFHETPREVEASARFGRLVALESGGDVVLKGVAFPYVTPATREFVEALGARHRRACGKPLMVTSAARPATRQPKNSVALSVHPTGMAIDLRKPTGRCLTWLRATLLELEESGAVEATEERRPPHFHVAVFPTSYRRYAAAHPAGEPLRVTKDVAVAQSTQVVRVTKVAATTKGAKLTKATRAVTVAKAPRRAPTPRRYKVRDGDTLWDIARANRVTVKQLLVANGMRGKASIRPGQRLVLPKVAAAEVEAGQ